MLNGMLMPKGGLRLMLIAIIVVHQYVKWDFYTWRT